MMRFLKLSLYDFMNISLHEKNDPLTLFVIDKIKYNLIHKFKPQSTIALTIY